MDGWQVKSVHTHEMCAPLLRFGDSEREGWNLFDSHTRRGSKHEKVQRWTCAERWARDLCIVIFPSSTRYTLAWYIICIKIISKSPRENLRSASLSLAFILFEKKITQWKRPPHSVPPSDRLVQRASEWVSKRGEKAGVYGKWGKKEELGTKV